MSLAREEGGGMERAGEEDGKLTGIVREGTGRRLSTSPPKA